MTASQKPLELKIQLFNGFAAWRDGTPLRYEQSVQEHKLLACLLLHHGKPVSRDWLASALWPESDEANAKRNLRAVLSRLRDTLGLALPAVKEHDAKSLLFDSSLLSTSVEVDVYDFEAAYGAGRWRQAVEAYQGTLLKGWYEDCFLNKEREYHGKYGLALAKAAENAAEAGRLHDALYFASRGLEDEHLIQEHFLELQMRFLAEFGRISDLRATYRNYRRIQEQEWGTGAVSPNVERLFDAYLLKAYTHTLPRQNDASPAPKPYVWNAPAPILGRETETQEVLALLAVSRLVTITGTGGMGKTRLARHALEQVRLSYPDGVLFLSLESLSEPALLWSQLATAMGIKDSLERSPSESVVGWLRPRELLLALDNCEHLEHACASLLFEVLTQCPNVQALATSRIPLHLAAEQQYALHPLRLPSATDASVERLAQVPSLALFVQRAHAIESQFALTKENAQKVARICTLVEGLPLAIELAASRVKTLSLTEIEEGLAQPFTVLYAKRFPPVERHAALHATLQWSFDLLSPSERRLLAEVSVFKGGWTLAAAQRVTGLEETDLQAGIQRLTESSLIQRSEPRGLPLHSLLATTRAFGLERLEETGNETLLRQRHAEWCYDLVQGVAPDAPSEQESLYAYFDATMDNLREASLWCVEQDVPLGCKIARSLLRYWNVRALFTEAQEWCRRLLGASGTTLSEDIGRLWNGLGWFAYSNQSYATSEEAYQSALSLFTALEDRRGIADVLGNAGVLARAQGEEAKATRLFEESRELQRQEGNLYGEATALGNLGLLSLSREDYLPAETCLKESLALMRPLGIPEITSKGLINLGKVYQEWGRFELATPYLREALDIQTELQDAWATAVCMEGVAVSALEHGKAREATLLLGASAHLRNEGGTPIEKSELPGYEAQVSRANALLGQEQFQEVWEEGSAYDLPKAIALAKETLG